MESPMMISAFSSVSRSRGKNRSKPVRRALGDVYCPRLTRTIPPRNPKLRHMDSTKLITGRMLDKVDRKDRSPILDSPPVSGKAMDISWSASIKTTLMRHRIPA